MPNAPYTFSSGTKAALYTWAGCSFSVSGDALLSEYTATESLVPEYTNVHLALEGARSVTASSSKSSRGGPRVLILGPDDVGKTSLARFLTSCAIRDGREGLVVVNLDPAEGVLTVPGTVSAAGFSGLLDVEEGWGSSPMSGPSAVPVKLPLVYYVGERGVEGDGFKRLVGRLGLAVQGRLKEGAGEAGCVIDTPGSLITAKPPYELLAHVVSEFQVSHICCVSNERVFNEVARRFDGKPCSSGVEIVKVVRLNKSGGCVDRDEAYMKALRAQQVRAYFFGRPDLSNQIGLSPRAQQVDFAYLSVYRLKGVEEAVQSGLSFGPGGLDDEDDDERAGGLRSALDMSGKIYRKLTTAEGGMRNNVVAVVNADPDASEEDIRDSSVVGFLYVVDVDEARGKITLLAPVAGRIPNRAIVWGHWPEEVIGMV